MLDDLNVNFSAMISALALRFLQCFEVTSISKGHVIEWTTGLKTNRDEKTVCNVSSLLFSAAFSS